MASDQEWCLECGAARTIIAAAPDWRIPLLLIGVVVALLAGGFAFALTQLDTTTPQVTVAATAAAQRPATPAIGSWPPGLDGYTVILARRGSRADADRVARALAGQHPGIGVLSTREHPQMRPTRGWEVYDGRYPSYALAQAAAGRAARGGQRQARPALVQRPGQG